MPWWGWVWIAVASLFMVAATVDDLDEATPRWKVLLDIAGHAGTVVVFLAFFLNRLADLLGGLLVVFVGCSVLWGVGRAIEEFRHTPTDPELSQREDRGIRILATIVWAVIMVPAWVLGASAATAHW